MSEVPKWLIENGGLWGVIALALAAVVVYLDRRSTTAYLKQIADLQVKNANLEATNAELHKQAKLDAQANTAALLQAADKNFQGVSHLHEIASALKR